MMIWYELNKYDYEHNLLAMSDQAWLMINSD